jgi:hypothetical protein
MDPKLLMPCHAMPYHVMSCHAKRRDVHSRMLYPNIRIILIEIVAQRGQCNTMPHIAKVTRTFCDDDFLQIAPHTLYSSDLTPSHFFLFGHLKNCFQGQQSRSTDELLSGIREILDAISVDTLEAVFRK